VLPHPKMLPGDDRIFDRFRGLSGDDLVRDSTTPTTTQTWAEDRATVGTDPSADSGAKPKRGDTKSPRPSTLY